MALRITTNLPALNARRNLGRVQGDLGRTLERLGSGRRINRAADDAAGLSISEKLRANVRALQQAERNAMDAVAVLQVAESAMADISTIAIRVKELAMQAATGTVSTQERGFLQTEYVALIYEAGRIEGAARFNDLALLAKPMDLTVQVGADGGAGDRLRVQVPYLSNIDMYLYPLTTVTSAQYVLGSVSDALDQMSRYRAGLGAFQNRIESIAASLRNQVENLTGAESRIRDADIAAETSGLTRAQIVSQAGVSVLSQANQLPALALQLLK
jgi:flagellin